jgi:hypothetical protein
LCTGHAKSVNVTYLRNFQLSFLLLLFLHLGLSLFFLCLLLALRHHLYILLVLYGAILILIPFLFGLHLGFVSGFHLLLV